MRIHFFCFLGYSLELKSDCCYDHQNMSYVLPTERTSLHCNLHSKKIKAVVISIGTTAGKKNLVEAQ